MPAKAIIDHWTLEQIAAMDAEIERRNFKDYSGITAWLAERGLEINRTSVADRGLMLKKRLQKVKDATQGARMIAESAPDDADQRSAAVIAMIQSELFDVMVTLQDLDEATNAQDRLKLLKDASLSLNNIAKSSLNQKQFERDIRDKERAKAAEELGSAVKKAGLSDSDWAAIRANFLGIETDV
jgi:hypothetical protein